MQDSELAPVGAVASPAPVPRPRRTLAGVVVRLVVFVLPLVALAAWLELKLAALDNSYTIKRRQMEAGLDRFEILVAGSSDALGGVDPGRLRLPGYNLANGSQSLHYDLGIISKYLDRLPRLRLVAVVHPPSYLQYEMLNGAEAWRRHFYDRFWDVRNEVPSPQLITLQRWSSIALYTPLTSLEYAAKGFDVTLTDGIDPNGWIASPPDPYPACLTPEWTKGRAEGHRQQMKPESWTRNRARAVAFAKRLQDKDAKMVMVWSPVTPGYRQYFGESALETQREEHAELAKEAGIRFFDYSADPRFVDGDFYDADHLTLGGALKFTAIFQQEVVDATLSAPSSTPP